MYTFGVKKWIDHMHMPSGHNVAVGLDHLIHDERFWPILLAVGFTVFLLVLFILLGIYGDWSPTETDLPPFLPYRY